MDITPFTQGSRPQIDYELVCRARERGDERAYADLMKRYRDSVYVMLLRMTSNPTEAEDLTMEAFGKAFKSLKSYEPINTFSTWLFKIAARTCIDFIRRQRMQMLSLDGMTAGHNNDETTYEMPIPAEDDNAEECLIRQQRYEMLRGIIGELKPHYRELVQLRYFEEKSYEEIAEATHLPLGTVKVRLYRAHDLLHALIKAKSSDLF